jgi:hypothetical protein
MTIAELQSTVVFVTYWYYIFERHLMYERRLRGDPPPWIKNKILQNYRFTNVFRILDRVTQFLVRYVIYESGGSMEDKEVVFRTLLFKHFNSISAWTALRDGLGYVPSWNKFNLPQYARILGDARKKGVKIWNPAYTQRPQVDNEIDKKYTAKHERYLALLETVMQEGITAKLKRARTYGEVFYALKRPGLYGDFISMQLATDLNYSEVINFSEDDFIVPGPGCLDGMQKCFGIRPNPALAAEIIHRCVEEQEGMFSDLGLQPVTLFGRRLTAIDLQNCFCECDKFARYAHPEYNLQRTEIKQTFRSNGPLEAPFFPPKWGTGIAIATV